MNADYLREQPIIDKSEKEKKIELLVSVLKTKKELDVASQNFEFAENELIDYYVYQMKAIKTKLDFLVNLAKKNGISIDMIHEIYYRRNHIA